MRILNKNAKPFHGVPMVARAIRLAKQSRLFDDIVVSTDGRGISEIADFEGASVFFRGIDDGSRGTQDVAREVLNHYRDCALACVLYPCTPLLLLTELVQGYRALHFPSASPFAISTVDGQDAGGFYWGFAFAFGNLPLDGATKIPVEHHRDINVEDDWAAAERLYEGLHEQEKAAKGSV